MGESTLDIRRRLEGTVGPILPAEVTAMRTIRRDGFARLPESPSRARLLKRGWIRLDRPASGHLYGLTPTGQKALAATDSFGDPG